MRDNYFSELKENEILMGRIQMAEAIQPFVGKYYSDAFVRQSVFKQTTEEIERLDIEFEEELQIQPQNQPQPQPKDEKKDKEGDTE